MQTRKLGQQCLEVSALGLGCMGMPDSYGGRDEAESVATINRALDRIKGCNAAQLALAVRARCPAPPTPQRRSACVRRSIARPTRRTMGRPAGVEVTPSDVRPNS